MNSVLAETKMETDVPKNDGAEVTVNAVMVQTTALVDSKGDVQLPVTQNVERNSQRFFELLQEIVPEELFEELKGHLEHQKARYSRLEILFCVAIVVLMGGLTVYLFPRSVPPAVIKYTDIKNPFPILRGKWRNLSIETDRLLYGRDSSKPQECLNLVEKNLEELTSALKDPEEDFSAIRHLLINLSNALRQLPYSRKSEAKQLYSEALTMLDFAAEREPDDFIWKFAWISLASKKYLPGDGGDYRLYNAGRIAIIHVVEIQSVIGRIEELMQRIKIAQDKNKQIDEARLQELDLIYARLLVMRWIIKGGEDKNEKKGDPGVDDREKAWRIVSGKTYSNNVDFVELQLFIVTRIMENVGRVKGYYFNGVERWRNTFLEEKQQEIAGYLNKARTEK